VKPNASTILGRVSCGSRVVAHRILVVALATESYEFAMACYAWSLVGLLAAFLQSHASQPVFRATGALLWLGGLLGIISSIGGNWQAAVMAGATGDLAWLMMVAVVAVIVVYLVGKWWGEFYAAISFVVVPVLSIFGLSIPMVASLEVVFALISAMVIGIFLVSTESLLLRWQRGAVGRGYIGVALELLLEIGSDGKRHSVDNWFAFSSASDFASSTFEPANF
jgi:hypothetical protein